VRALEQLIRVAQARWIILPYSSGGRATVEELSDVLRRNGRLPKVREINYRQNVMARMTSTRQWIPDTRQPHREFLFLLEK
jgi:adenine-specific DNA-methyltransferase